MTPFLHRLSNRLQRTLARGLARRPALCLPQKPIISFTFDDFPESALTVAGELLQEFGARGTYYTSFGLMGKTAPTGKIFSEHHIAKLLAHGHELGCHTFDHCHSWDTPPSAFAASTKKNLAFLEQIAPGAKMNSSSYPISMPRPGTKRHLENHFAFCRFGGQIYNRGLIDLNLVSAFFIEQSRDHLDAIKRIIDQTCAQNAWLIFATHDVEPKPTRYGCTPALFREILRCSQQSGAELPSRPTKPGNRFQLERIQRGQPLHQCFRQG